MSVSNPAQTETSGAQLDGARNMSGPGDPSSSPPEPCILTGFRPAPSPPTVPGPPRFRSTRVDGRDYLSGLKALVDGNDVSAAAVFQAAWALVLRTYLARWHVSLNYAAVRRRPSVTDTTGGSRQPVEMMPCTFRIRADDTLLDVIRQRSAASSRGGDGGSNTCVVYWPEECWSSEQPSQDEMEFVAETEQLAKVRKGQSRRQDESAWVYAGKRKGSSEC
ncbi:hypothetical protein E4U42_000346 [Claviceps africana]|uniref:Uncharacterized protein n=1 Tax=Claviceps africana TaxID=83212 RepID=A0A8K0J1S6_9HYPO|nr:hypothetical protein E4U42_000346 [Claviceps africana]